jgi:hypothetical protein
MTSTTSWHGTPQERRDLLRALSRNCACESGPMGTRLSSCAAHRMLVEDQRALNGLVYARRLADRLRQEEWITRRPTRFTQSRSFQDAA